MTEYKVYSGELPILSTAVDLSSILRIQTEVLKAIHDSLYEKGLIQLMPVIFSSITDPLNHPVYEASIDYLDQKLMLTKSMILHKQIAIAMLGVKGIYIMSPNVRLETGKKYLTSNKHLLEFTQVDIELSGATSEEFMVLMEEVIIKILSRVKERCWRELERLKVELQIPQAPFKRFNSWELHALYGEGFEQEISLREKDLFWIADFEREFYDKEDTDRLGHYLNYDLYYPDGFGEALSGGERDFEYEILLRKLMDRKQSPNDFEIYMEYAKSGALVPSAGGGLGVERLIRFITKRNHIKEITPFPKLPGQRIYL